LAEESQRFVQITSRSSLKAQEFCSENLGEGVDVLLRTLSGCGKKLVPDPLAYG